MDLTAIAFYALVCAALAATVPQRLTLPRRALIGAAVGVVAAALLPVVRGATGL